MYVMMYKMRYKNMFNFTEKMNSAYQPMHSLCMGLIRFVHLR